MLWTRFRLMACGVVLALGASAVRRRGGRRARASAGGTGSAGPSGAGDCIAHHPNSGTEYPVWYAQGCTGHDEPELDPVSSLAGSAQELTWTAVLPTDGTVPVSSVGPTFWWGGTVTDPNPQSLFGQGFPGRGAVLPRCDRSQLHLGRRVQRDLRPEQVLGLHPGVAGRRQELRRDRGVQCRAVRRIKLVAAGDERWGHDPHPLLRHLRQRGLAHPGHRPDHRPRRHRRPEQQVWPHASAFSQQQIGNALGWGIVDDTPNSFVWEIGHTSPFTTPASQFCVPGQTFCDSYDTAHWLGFSPLQIKSVTFANGSTANKWAVVSDFGGTAEVNQYCPSYGGPFCTYPWYVFNGTDSAFTYGADYPGTKFDYGHAQPVRHHHAMRRPVRPRLHLLRHGAEPDPVTIGPALRPYAARAAPARAADRPARPHPGTRRPGYRLTFNQVATIMQ